MRKPPPFRRKYRGRKPITPAQQDHIQRQLAEYAKIKREQKR